jgi:hypothetical protein
MAESIAEMLEIGMGTWVAVLLLDLIFLAVRLGSVRAGRTSISPRPTLVYLAPIGSGNVRLKFGCIVGFGYIVVSEEEKVPSLLVDLV